MKPTTLLLSFLTTASAWKLELFASDGRKVTTHGTQDSGCKNIAFTPALKVKQAKFSPKTDWYPDPSTFELYVNKGCQGLSYRNGGGDHKLTPPRVIRSYKVK
ncbi:hypothetical protein QBC35DRAFT_535557 [Podospora australis]|uniref:Uncharacterized protein n=1 Tax=Podospora australis TaxID=1536484 RepID=A0AAN6WL92_9PEZI|nr:hypothetical protein QBC35DRAFT_535557 [Podospora australis]